MITQKPVSLDVEKTSQSVSMTADVDDLTLSTEEKQLILTLDRYVYLLDSRLDLSTRVVTSLDL